ncbi:MAG: hypothetical protein LUG16_02035 [Candidatus Gastranaerophilales bacterium]|nr:hypothetical protein [Candidatus Gastranaerophilales bacterium]
MKVFGKEKEGNKVIYYIFGFKISYSNKNKNAQKQVHNNSYNIPLNYIIMNNAWFGEKEKRWYIANRCYETLGYYPNLTNPKTFNEKLQWMNLNYFNPTEEICNDKIDFKDYIKEKLGDGYTAKLLGIYDSVDDIDFEKLPEKFVLKNTLTGDDNGVKIVRSKSSLDIDRFKYEVNNIFQQWTSGYYTSFNRNSNKQVRVFAEEYLGAPDECLDDYKFMCFHGKFELGYVDVRIPNQKGKIYYFDNKWNLLPIKYSNHEADTSFFPKKPSNFDRMIEIAEFLAKDFPFVRVDFYIVKDKLYLGELTFLPGGGLGKYSDDWDLKIGNLLDLTKIESKFITNDKAKILLQEGNYPPPKMPSLQLPRIIILSFLIKPLIKIQNVTDCLICTIASPPMAGVAISKFASHAIDGLLSQNSLSLARTLLLTVCSRYSAQYSMVRIHI